MRFPEKIENNSLIRQETPCIMCVQHRGGVQYSGGYHEYRGGVQYRGGYHDEYGGYLEYCGGVQYRGGYHEYHGGYLEYRGGYHDARVGIS